MSHEACGVGGQETGYKVRQLILIGDRAIRAHGCGLLWALPMFGCGSAFVNAVDAVKCICVQYLQPMFCCII